MFHQRHLRGVAKVRSFDHITVDKTLLHNLPLMKGGSLYLANYETRS